jgi:hypothetical protein
MKLIPAIGKSEYINIPEFKNADDLCHRIKVQARADDIESQMGKQLTLNHFLQYAGSNISGAKTSEWRCASRLS